MFEFTGNDPWDNAAEGPSESRHLIRLSEIISALSYALDLTEGQPQGHAIRSCMIGMRLAQQIGMGTEGQGDLYYSLLLKDAGCSSNASRLFHILESDDILAKRDVKTTDWTRRNWESVHYALTHVAIGKPFLKRMETLFQIAANQKQDSRELITIRCERGAHIAMQLGFSGATADVHRMVAVLKDTGLNHTQIFENLFDNFLENRLRFMGFVLQSRMEIFYEYNAALIAIPWKDLVRYEIKTGDTEGLVNYPLSIQGIKMAALIIDRDEEVKCSFRSKGDFDVNTFARNYFDGGGHFNAAGGRSTDTLEVTVQRFINALNENSSQLQ